jgi:hypothetical protein
MSNSVYLCLYVKRSSFLSCLQRLAVAENQERGSCDHYLFIEGNTPLDRVQSKLSRDAWYTDEPDEKLVIDKTVKISYKKFGQEASLFTNLWMQEMFKPSAKNFYLVAISFCNAEDLITMPVDHPSHQILEYLATELEPVLGWYDTVNIFPEYNEAYSQPPWLYWLFNLNILGPPFSTIVKEVVDLDDPNNGLFYCKRLGKDLYWIAGPGTFEKLPGKFYRGETPATQRHLEYRQIDEERKIMKILRTIPASVLD